MNASTVVSGTAVERSGISKNLGVALTPAGGWTRPCAGRGVPHW